MKIKLVLTSMIAMLIILSVLLTMVVSYQIESHIRSELLSQQVSSLTLKLDAVTDTLADFHRQEGARRNVTLLLVEENEIMQDLLVSAGRGGWWTTRVKKPVNQA